MEKRRRQDVEGAGNREDVCGETGDGKDKGHASHWLVVFLTMKLLPIFKVDGRKLLMDFRAQPVPTMKRVLFKLALVLWGLFVFFCLLNLLGFKVNPVQYIKGHSVVQSGSFGLFGGDSPFSLGGAAAVASQEEEAKDKEEDEPIIQQILPVARSTKIDKKREIQLSCEEATCQTQCRAKAKPKCQKSKSCMQEREKICKKRCRKARCEERCKDEVKLGYVEREQKMDKCKEGCSGSTAVHNKCIKKCHSDFKPCKQRCHDVAHKYQCDRIDVPPPKLQDTSSLRDDSSSDNSGDGGSYDDDSSTGDDDDDELL